MRSGNGVLLLLGLMLWLLREALLRLPGVTERDRLHEVHVLDGAVRTGHHVAVVAVEVEALHRVQKQFEAVVALGRRRRVGESYDQSVSHTNSGAIK